jgi:ribosome-binding factor A
MSENPRARKLADRIKEIVASMLDTKIKDPRLGFVTITDVRVTGDLQNASVFYTVLGDETAHQRTAAALESCKGLLRSEVGKQTGVRLTPTLEFHVDSVPEAAQQITDAISEAQRRDAEVDALRIGKHYAGEADPYKKAPALGLEHLHDGGFDLVDHEENMGAPDEYHDLDDFDSITDHEHFDEAQVDGDVDVEGGLHL